MSVGFDSVDRLKALIETELDVPLAELRENDVQGTMSKTYKGRTADGRAIFVKVGIPELLDRADVVVRQCRGLDFIPAALDRGGLEIDGRRVQVTECRCGETIIEPYRLTDVQFKSLIDGYAAFSARIQALQEFATAPRTSGFATRYRDVLLAYASRSRFVRWWLSDLLKVAARAESIDRRLTSVIHGDFNFYNFSFSKDGLVAIYDFDSLTHGMPCEDLLFSFTCRFRDSSLRRGDRNKLLRMLSEMIGRTKWPAEDWRAAIDLQRLLEAADLVREYSNSPLAAIKIVRRDRRHALMLRALRGKP